MTWDEYPYTGFWIKDGMIKRPLVEVEISHGKRTIKQLAVIDSGAEMTMISGDIATFLGIDISILQNTTLRRLF